MSEFREISRPGVLWRVDCLESPKICVSLDAELPDGLTLKRSFEPGYLFWLDDKNEWAFLDTRTLTAEEFRAMVGAGISAARLQGATETGGLVEDFLWCFATFAIWMPAIVAIGWVYMGPFVAFAAMPWLVRRGDP